MANKLVLDFTRWTFEQYQTFLLNFQRQNWEISLPDISAVVVSWTYDVPVGPDAWKKLPFPELGPISEAVRNTLEIFSAGVDIDDVKVDLTRWTMEEFLAFRQAAKTSNIAEFEKIVLKVARPKGYVQGERLSAVQGIAILKAITDAQGKLFAKGE